MHVVTPVSFVGKEPDFFIVEDFMRILEESVPA